MIRTTALLALALASFAVRPASADDSKQALADILKTQAKLHSLHSLTADVTLTAGNVGNLSTTRGTIECLKPNYLLLDMGQGKDRRYHISNGKDYCANDANDKWTTVKAAAHGDNFRNDVMLWSDFYVFYAPTDAKKMLSSGVDTISHKSIDGLPCEIITTYDKRPPVTTITVAIAPDGLVHQFTIDAGKERIVDTWSNIKMNPSLKPAEFKPKH